MNNTVATRTTGVYEYKVEPYTLINYIKVLGKKLKKAPDKTDVINVINDNKYQIELFINYFESWDDVLGKAGFNKKSEKTSECLNSNLSKWIK